MSQSEQQLSARDMAGLFRSVQNGDVTDAQIQQVWSQIPEETKVNGIQSLFTQFVVPRIGEVRERSEADVSNQQVRARYAELPDDEQQEVFNEAVGDVLATLFEIRNSPREGMNKLQGLLRDPFTIEGLLLIFDNDEYIDEQYSAQMKDFAAMHLRWAGVALLPEMYDPAVVEAVAEEIGFDIERRTGDDV